MCFLSFDLSPTHVVGDLREKYTHLARRLGSLRWLVFPQRGSAQIRTPGRDHVWFVLPIERLTIKQQAQLLQLYQGEVEFSVAYQLVQAFIALLHQQTDKGLTEWLEQAQKSAVAELISFARGLVRDEAAVRAGLSLHWSQGQVEGAVNRLKLIKRSMYGRAKFDLLRIRVLYAA